MGYKTFARILLILSAVNYAFAGLPLSWAIQEARTDLVEDIAEAPEKRQRPYEGFSEGSEKRSAAGHVHPRVFDVKLLPEPNPDYAKFFNSELKEKLNEYYVMATIGALTSGLGRGSWSEGSGKTNPHGSTVGRGLIARAFGVSRGLNGHPQNQEELVTRSLANLRAEDLRFLRTLSRRLLDNLD